MRSWPISKVSAHLPMATDPWCLSLPLLPSIQFYLPCLPKFCPINRPKQLLYSLTKKSNTETEGAPTPKVHKHNYSIGPFKYLWCYFSDPQTIVISPFSLLNRPIIFFHFPLYWWHDHYSRASMIF